MSTLPPTIRSSVKLEVINPVYSYQLTAAGATQLTRYGFYIPANTAAPVPHISLYPYPSGQFSTSQLVIGDFWLDNDGFHFYDGINIGTLITSGTSASTSSASPSASYAKFADSGSAKFIPNTDASLLIYMYSNFI